MNIKVLGLKEGIVETVHGEHDPKELELDTVDLHYLSKIEVDGTVELISGTLLFRGKLNYKIEKICARCLATETTIEQIPFNLSYEIRHQEFIDTIDDLRDILMLERAGKFLCRPDCKGICPNCGLDLNHETCRCNK